jgi:hypothetical protein
MTGTGTFRTFKREVTGTGAFGTFRSRGDRNMGIE